MSTLKQSVDASGGASKRKNKKKKTVNLAEFVMKCFEKGAFGDGASRSVTTKHFHQQAAEKTLREKKIRRMTN